MGDGLELSKGSQRRNTGVPNHIDTRDKRSDYTKALAIIGVVSIHAGFPSADVFRFCVPVFVTIWAFHYECGLARRIPSQIWGYVKQRFLRLLIPYGFWSVFYIMLFHTPSEWSTTPFHTILGGWFGGTGWSGQYFFIILFQLTWLLPLIRLGVNQRTVWIVLIAGTILNTVVNYLMFNNQIISGVGDRLFVYWIPYVFLGVAFARGYPRSFPWLIPIAVTLLLMVPCEFVLIAARHVKFSAYLLPSVMLGSVALLVAIGPRLSPVTPYKLPFGLRIKRTISYIGQHSFVIFVANPLVIEGLRHLGLISESSFINFICKIMLVSLTIGVSLVIGWILRRSRLGILIGG